MSSTVERNTAGRIIRARALEWLADESGPTATEYAVMLAVLLIVVIGAVTAMGQVHRQVWLDVGTALTPVVTAAS